MNRIFPLCLTACLTLCLAAETALAADPAQTIARYLDEDTVAVARVDLTKVDVGATWKFLTTYVPARPQEIEQMKAGWTALLSSLRQEKVSEAFLVVNLADFPNPGPFAIIPVGSGGDHGKVASLMFSGKPNGPASVTEGRRVGPFEHCERLGDVVFCGSLKTLKRLKSLKPAKRPHLAAAFQAVDNAAVQFVFVPSKQQHRVLAELMPRLPKSLGGMNGKEISKAVQWAALGVQLPPEPKATLIVSADSGNSAKRLKATVAALARTYKNLPDVKRTVTDLEKFSGLLAPTVKGNRFTMTLDATGKEGRQVIALLGSSIGRARAAAQRTSSRNNLKQFGLAMHNFHDVYKGFPPHASYDKKEKRLLSWRVYLLPFLDQKKLFDAFHLDEPWDSKHNKTLIAKMPQVFADPGKKTKKPGTTRYLAPIGPKNIFEGKPVGIRFRDIIDGTSNTIMIVEAAPEKAVVWTKPDDIVIDAKNPMKGLLEKDAKGFQASFADGSVRLISEKTKPETLRAYFTRNGGEVINE